MLNFLSPYLGALKAAAIIAACLVLFWAGHHFGAQGVQSKWDAEIAWRKQVENAAILKRTQENAAEAENNRETNRLITKAHDAQISQLRTAIANAPRLRVGTAICGGSPRAPEAAGTSSGNGIDPGAGVVREDARRDLDALKIRVEEAFAAGRACQAFVESKGMTP